MSAPARNALPALYVGSVQHRRFRPRPHRLKYRLFMLHLDVDDLAGTARASRLLSVNRWNLISFHEADHGPKGEGSLGDRVRRLARERGLDWDGSRVSIVAMPRVFGYVFNPLSLYLCRNADGRLAALIYEVRNTFGGMHHYAFDVDRPEAGTLRHQCAKDFFVSPFLPMEMNYRFHLKPPAEHFSLAIEDNDGEGRMLVATMTLARRALSTRALAGVLVGLPLMTFKVIVGIHWEALRLWWKRTPFYSPSEAIASALPPSERSSG
ncbi:DUF1365 domain-containing protein [Segnochrobactrum spirostomi]|nr:DUF1365 domain-containing protein [Segnochrobactrum spirostomi]